MRLSLEEQVAQRLILGFEGPTPGSVLERFLRLGLGGVIFFRDNFQGMEPRMVARLLATIAQSLPEQAPPPLLSIDQEGGQVERLPHTVFPASVSPRAVALTQVESPLKFAEETYATMARHLAMLGFNMNFFPTLDVDLERTNPIIGVRSFGQDPDTVWRLAKVAMLAHHSEGILTVGKHFPGHGNGTVDSHLDLPVLNFTEKELQPFRQAIQHDLPAMMVSHGFYPALQTTEVERNLPASASPTIIQGLLRQQCGFKGLVLSDDMCMGAITRHKSPVQAALDALRAGVDMLIYKQSTETELEVLQQIVRALESGELDREAHEAALERIFEAKRRLKPFYAAYEDINLHFAPERLKALSHEVATNAVSVLHGKEEAVLPLDLRAPLLLVHPDRVGIVNYSFDQPTSPELPALFQDAGFSDVRSFAYSVREPFDAERLASVARDNPAQVVFVTFNPLIHAAQVDIYRWLKTHLPDAKLILASAGTPYCRDAMPDVNLHLALCSYRPSTMRALVERSVSTLYICF